MEVLDMMRPSGKAENLAQAKAYSTPCQICLSQLGCITNWWTWTRDNGLRFFISRRKDVRDPGRTEDRWGSIERIKRARADCDQVGCNAESLDDIGRIVCR